MNSLFLQDYPSHIVTVRNFWSLQIDEAMVADKIKSIKELEVFFPINSQLEDIDLIVYNKKNHKTHTVQVKSSKSWKSNEDEYSAHRVPIGKIDPKKVNYFVFACYFSSMTKKQKEIVPRYIVIKTSKLLEKIRETKVVKKGICKFSFNLYKGKIADFWDLKSTIDKNKGVDYTSCLDNFKQLK